MKPNQPPAFPAEMGIMAGVAMGASGQLPALVLAVILWLLLRRLRPQTPRELLFVTAFVAGSVPFAFLGIIAGYATPLAAIEPAVVSLVAFLLFFTHRRIWAFALLAHAFCIITMRCYDLSAGAYELQYQRLYLGAIGMQALLAWMLIAYIRRPAPAPAVSLSSEVTTDETRNG